jgi:hypothetical protein
MNEMASVLHDPQPALWRERSRLPLHLLPKRLTIGRNAVIGRNKHNERYGWEKAGLPASPQRFGTKPASSAAMIVAAPKRKGRSCSCQEGHLPETND